MFARDSLEPTSVDGECERRSEEAVCDGRVLLGRNASGQVRQLIKNNVDYFVN